MHSTINVTHVKYQRSWKLRVKKFQIAYSQEPENINLLKNHGFDSVHSDVNDLKVRVPRICFRTKQQNRGQFREHKVQETL